jgi:hypothetical protein
MPPRSPARTSPDAAPELLPGLGTSLPFQGWAPDVQAAPPMDASAFAALRSGAARPASPHAEEGDDIGTSTVTLKVSPAAQVDVPPASTASPRRSLVTLGGGMRLTATMPAVEVRPPMARPAGVPRSPAPEANDDDDDDGDVGRGTVQVVVPPGLRDAPTAAPLYVQQPALAPPLAPPLTPPLAPAPFERSSAPLPPPPVPSAAHDASGRPYAATTPLPIFSIEPTHRAVEAQVATRASSEPRALDAPARAADIERWMVACAAVRAAVWSGRTLADALEELDVDETTYRFDEARLKAALDRELAAGRLDASERWLRVLADARRGVDTTDTDAA